MWYCRSFPSSDNHSYEYPRLSDTAFARNRPLPRLMQSTLWRLKGHKTGRANPKEQFSNSDVKVSSTMLWRVRDPHKASAGIIEQNWSRIVSGTIHFTHFKSRLFMFKSQFNTTTESSSKVIMSWSLQQRNISPANSLHWVRLANHQKPHHALPVSAEHYVFCCWKLELLGWLWRSFALSYCHKELLLSR